MKLILVKYTGRIPAHEEPTLFCRELHDHPDFRFPSDAGWSFVPCCGFRELIVGRSVLMLQSMDAPLAFLTGLQSDGAAARFARATSLPTTSVRLSKAVRTSDRVRKYRYTGLPAHVHPT